MLGYSSLATDALTQKQDDWIPHITHKGLPAFFLFVCFFYLQVTKCICQEITEVFFYSISL